jgi:hypothetical protein
MQLVKNKLIGVDSGLTQPLFCQPLTVAIQVFFWQQLKAAYKTCLVVYNQANGCLTQSPIQLRQCQQEPGSAGMGVFMKAKTADLQPDNLSKEIHIQISERNGQQILVIKEQNPAKSIGEYEVEIPASLLPELKRVVETIEQKYNAESAAMETTSQHSEIRFAHESEAEFARILDFYHIDWQYEPRSFVTERDEAGNPLRSFTPDFYLPEHDLYIEITTQKQSLVTKKNRKLRQLRELHPEINIKLLYASDYNKLIEKFAASKKRSETPNDNR